MVDGEGAVVGHGKEQPFPVGRSLGVAYRTAAYGGVPQGVGRSAEFPRFRIEGHAHQRVTHLFQSCGELAVRRGAEKHRPPICRKHGEGLKYVLPGICREGEHVIAVEICHTKVGRRVVHLHTAVCCGVHGRDYNVGGKHAPAPFRMDLPVNGGGYHGGIAQVQLAQAAAPVQDGAAPFTADVEHRQAPPSLRMDVAIHAPVAGVAPVGNSAGIEVFQIPFLDFQVVPDFETGLYETVGEIPVYRIRAHMNLPRERYLAGGCPVG